MLTNDDAKNDKGRAGGVRKKASAQHKDNLRRETTEMVAGKIRECLKARNIENRES